MSEWVEVAKESEFVSKDRKLVDLGGTDQIGLFKLEDGFYAINAWCSHQKANMISGDIEDHELECPLHGARFSLKSGDHLCLPAVKPVKRYDVKVEDGRIFMKR
ncbi:MAG: non-heme iron oxygenase ferredoxin subunit [Kiritimatiellae bacterium]|nr:non-heme iron oxygenase ferredoxin subunit [Kiritimatiellia bacterium]MCO5062471.1 non-heme iron oxygenase ferredoxin subunit [Kiritimatiellia bacterium]MCO6400106.1 non-heme iron oxygenase ferredoxin subunit [Verrucomicrobiota bacterium]